MSRLCFMDWVPVASAPVLPVVVPLRTIESEEFGLFFRFDDAEVLGKHISSFNYSIRSDGIVLFSFEKRQQYNGNDIADDYVIAARISREIAMQSGAVRWFYFRDDGQDENNVLAFGPIKIFDLTSEVFLSTVPEFTKHVFLSQDLEHVLRNDTALALLRSVRINGSISQRYALLKFRENIAKSFSEVSIVGKLRKFNLPVRLRLLMVAIGGALAILAGVLAAKYFAASMYEVVALAVSLSSLMYFSFDVGLRRRRALRMLRNLRGALLLGNIYSTVVERIYTKMKVSLGCTGQCLPENLLARDGAFARVRPCDFCLSAVPTNAFDAAIEIVLVKERGEEDKIRNRKEALMLSIFAVAVFLSLFVM